MKPTKKVLRIFGKAIRPANWTIFAAGIVLIPLGIATIWWDLSVAVLGAVLITLQGVDFAISGYGNIKEDEDDIKEGK